VTHFGDGEDGIPIESGTYPVLGLIGYCLKLILVCMTADVPWVCLLSLSLRRNACLYVSGGTSTDTNRYKEFRLLLSCFDDFPGGLS